MTAPSSPLSTTTAADRALPCGCVPCVCGDDERCRGCGARYCARHSPSEGAPPAPEQEDLVRAGETLVLAGQEYEITAKGARLLNAAPSPRAQETRTDSEEADLRCLGAERQGPTKDTPAGGDGEGARGGPDAGDWSGLCGAEFWTEDADYAKCDRAKGHPGECYGRIIEEPDEGSEP